MLPRALAWLSFSTVVAALSTGGEAPRLTQSELAALGARDARLAFTAESARRARAALESAPAEGRDQEEERAVALLALGGGGAGGDVPRLEARLESGGPAEQRAALLALGELGGAGWPALERALARAAAGREDVLCLALALAARGGAIPAEERLGVLAAGEDETALRARQALAWRRDQDPQGLAETIAAYYELRWTAARAFGLIDGQRGAEARRAELFADVAFRELVLLAAASALPPATLRPHVLEILSAGEHPGALRAATLSFPEELERALATRKWEPTVEGWRTVLATIDAARTERRAKGLLGRAFRASVELEPFAGRLLFRGGNELSWGWVDERLARSDPETRARLIEACGDRGERQLIPELEALVTGRPELGLAGAARVALVRLGSTSARQELEAIVAGPPAPGREQVLAAIVPVLHDERLWRFAEQALRRADLPSPLRLDLQAGLVRGGASAERAELRAALSGNAARAQRLACVRALAQRPDVEDVELLAGIFPAGDLELDVELALALLSERHPSTGGLLASALWGPDWNLCMLAGGLIVASAGTRGLLDELAAAPRTARENDLRRGGFALGEWGGLAAVEELARARSEADPLLQGALLGALASRAAGGGELALPRPRVDLEFPAGAGGPAPAGNAKGKGKPKPKRGRAKAGG